MMARIHESPSHTSPSDDGDSAPSSTRRPQRSVHARPHGHPNAQAALQTHSEDQTDGDTPGEDGEDEERVDIKLGRIARTELARQVERDAALAEYRALWLRGCRAHDPTTSSIEQHPMFPEAERSVLQALDSVQSGVHRNISSHIRYIKSGEFEWSTDLAGTRLYAHFGASAHSQAFLIALRALAALRRDRTQERQEENEAEQRERPAMAQEHLTFATALALMREARDSRRNRTDIVQGTSSYADWQPMDCRRASEVAAERYHMRPPPEAITKRKSTTKRTTTETPKPSPRSGARRLRTGDARGEAPTPQQETPGDNTFVEHEHEHDAGGVAKEKEVSHHTPSQCASPTDEAAFDGLGGDADPVQHETNDETTMCSMSTCMEPEKARGEQGQASNELQDVTVTNYNPPCSRQEEKAGPSTPTGSSVGPGNPHSTNSHHRPFLLTPLQLPSSPHSLSPPQSYTRSSNIFSLPPVEQKDNMRFADSDADDDRDPTSKRAHSPSPAHNDSSGPRFKRNRLDGADPAELVALTGEFLAAFAPSCTIGTSDCTSSPLLTAKNSPPALLVHDVDLAAKTALFTMLLIPPAIVDNLGQQNTARISGSVRRPPAGWLLAAVRYPETDTNDTTNITSVSVFSGSNALPERVCSQVRSLLLAAAPQNPKNLRNEIRNVAAAFYKSRELPRQLDVCDLDPTGFARCVAVAVHLVVGVQVPQTVFTWAWLGALNAVSAIDNVTRFTELASHTELPELPGAAVSPYHSHSGLWNDTMSASLDVAKNQLDLLDKDQSALRSFCTQLRDIDACAQRAIPLPSCPKSSVAELDEKIRWCAKLMEDSSNNNDDLQRRMAGYIHQKQSMSGTSSASRSVRELQAWIQSSIGQADIQLQSTQQREQDLVAELQEHISEVQQLVRDRAARV